MSERGAREGYFMLCGRYAKKNIDALPNRRRIDQRALPQFRFGTECCASVFKVDQHLPISMRV